MVKFRTNIYGYNKSDVASFVKEVASEYESIYEKLKNVTLEAENLRKENSKKGLERAKLFSWEKCADIMITEMKRRAGL